MQIICTEQTQNIHKLLRLIWSNSLQDDICLDNSNNKSNTWTNKVTLQQQKAFLREEKAENIEYGHSLFELEFAYILCCDRTNKLMDGKRNPTQSKNLSIFFYIFTIFVVFLVFWMQFHVNLVLHNTVDVICSAHQFDIFFVFGNVWRWNFEFVV